MGNYKLGYYDQMLYNLTKDFTMYDWRAFHTDEHLQVRDQITDWREKKLFVIEEAQNYLLNNEQWD